MRKLLYLDEYPKFINENEDETEDETKEYEDDDASDISYDPASASLKHVFKLVNQLQSKQRKIRQKLINSDKKDVTNRDLLIKKLESVNREIEFFDSEFQRILNTEESQTK